MTFKSEFGEFEVKVVLEKYANGRPAILLKDVVDGTPVLTATCNIPEEPLLSGYTFIKNYSENKGVLDFLLKNKMITLLKGRREDVPSGHVFVTVARVHPKVIQGNS